MSEQNDFQIEKGILKKYNGRDENVIIPDNVTAIAPNAFKRCSFIRSIIIPDSVTNIGKYAFEECSSLESIKIPEKTIIIGSLAFFGTAYYKNELNRENGLLYIGNHLIEANNDIEVCSIRKGTKTIAEYAFYRCKKLREVNIPSTVTRIGYSAFEGCIGLEHFEMPDSVSVIGGCAFQECKNLTDIKMSDNIRRIGNKAFDNCEKLSQVRLPETLVRIGDCDLLNERLNYNEIDNLARAIGGQPDLNLFLRYEIIRIILKSSSERQCAKILFEYLTRAEQKEFMDKYTVRFKSSVLSLIVKNNNLPALQRFLKLYDFSGDDIDEFIEAAKPSEVLTMYLLEFRGKKEVDKKTAKRLLRKWQKLFVLINNGKEYAVVKCKSDVGTIFIPSQIKELPVTTVSAAAFDGCNNMKELFIPETVTKIGICAFWACCGFTIHAPDGSYAKKYAEKKGIPFEDDNKK